MRIIFCFTVLLFFTLSEGNAQKNKVMRKHKTIRVSRKKALIICPIFENSKYPYHGIGIKFGDPVALSYKYYKSKKLAIAIDAGSAASGLYSKYYRERFDHNLTDDLIALQDSNQGSLRYTRHEIISEYVFEGRVLRQSKPEIFPVGLQSYFGLGWQLRKTAIKYHYFYETILKDREKGNFDSFKTVFGPTITVGLEYAYFKLPISTFIEASVFTDVVENPGWTKFQGGLGVRYIF